MKTHILSILFLLLCLTLALVSCGEGGHTHTAGEWIVDKNPTCTEAGSQHTECTECHETVSTAPIPATGNHTESDWIVDVAATGTTEGSKHTECTVCGQVMQNEKIPSLDSKGLAYTKNEDGTTCTVTGIGTCTDTDITIPKSIDGYTVTAISENAFQSYVYLYSITIPDSVTSVGVGAFSGCMKLTSATINGQIIGNGAFYGCTGLTSVTIGNGLTSIGVGAFYECKSLTSITIPDGVTSIGSYAFWGCTGLTSITLPDSVTSIGSFAFADCTGLTSITIPNSVTSIGSFAFADCTGLTSITILDSVTNIGNWVFDGCTSLTNITIPNSVTSIGDGAFYDCTGLTSIQYSGTKAQWQAITKDDYWNSNTGDYTVYCTDGTLTKAEAY